jgi:hypothetical protein
MKLRSITAKIFAFVLAYAMLTLSVSADLASDQPPPEVFPTFVASHVEQSMNGVAVIRSIDGVQYAFDQSGANLGAYSGWMFRGPQRYFTADGIVQTGWHQIGSNGYFFNRDGIMRIGSVLTDWRNDLVYSFDENGVWDGKAGQYSWWYTPKTVGDFLLDNEYPLDREYQVRLWSDSTTVFDTQEISDIGAVLQILQDHADSELMFAEKVSGDVVVESSDIYHRGNDDIVIRTMLNEKNLAAPFLCFSKDSAGNSYWYSSHYNFGIKLDDPGAYDKVLSLIRAKK